jgi:hypothetical protein
VNHGFTDFTDFVFSPDVPFDPRPYRDGGPSRALKRSANLYLKNQFNL